MRRVSVSSRLSARPRVSAARFVRPTIRPAVRVTVTMQSSVETHRSIIPKLIFITGCRAGGARSGRAFILAPSVTHPWLSRERQLGPPLKYERETLRLCEILRAIVIPRYVIRNGERNRKGIIKRFRVFSGCQRKKTMAAAAQGSFPGRPTDVTFGQMSG